MGREKNTTREKRVDVINRLIDAKTRPMEDINDRSFFECEICYTCKFLNVLTSKCFLSHDDVVKKFDSSDSDDSSNVREPEYFSVPTRIRDPIYYRCEGWEEGARLT